MTNRNKTDKELIPLNRGEDTPLIATNAKQWRLFHLYYNLPWVHNLERNAKNLSLILKGTEDETKVGRLRGLITSFDWDEVTKRMDLSVSQKLQGNIEKQTIVKVSRYQKKLEGLLDRFWRQVEQADEDEPIINSISDLKTVIELQIKLANLPENGRGENEEESGDFLKKEKEGMDRVVSRIKESTKNRRLLSDAIDVVAVPVEGEVQEDIVFDD